MKSENLLKHRKLLIICIDFHVSVVKGKSINQECFLENESKPSLVFIDFT